MRTGVEIRLKGSGMNLAETSKNRYLAKGQINDDTNFGIWGINIGAVGLVSLLQPRGVQLVHKLLPWAWAVLVGELLTKQTS